MSQALVSVIIPTYNHGKYIGEALDSVMRQTYPNWEAIIINNFSTDDTDQVLEAYTDPRIRVEKFANGGVVARSRNRGLSAAHGEYIAFLDSDDVWMPSKLERQLKVMERHHDILLCSTALRIIPGGTRSPLIPLGNRRLTLRGVMARNTIFNSSVMIRRSVLDSVGLFSEDPDVRTVEDYEYWLRIIKYQDKSVFFIETPLLRYRVTGQNASCFGKKIDEAQELRKLEKIGTTLFTGREQERYLRYKRSEIARRHTEFCDDPVEKKDAQRRMMFSGVVRMYMAHALKRAIAFSKRIKEKF